MIPLMTMAKPAHASGTLATPPSLLYSVSVWAYCIPGTIVSYPNPSCTMQNVAISCSASSWAGLAPCVTAAAGGPVAINNYYGNYVGGNPFGSTNPVTSHIGCPDHAQVTGNTCTCTDPYVPEEPDKTRCVLEQYTLTLVGMGTEIEPSGTVGGGTSTRMGYVSVLGSQTKQPKSGAVVRVTVDVDVSSGGHDHGDNPTRRDRGSISGCKAADVPDAYDCTTAGNGYAQFTFDAPEASGTHNFTATCVSPACTNQDNGKIDVKVDGLWPIPESGGWVLIQKPGAKHGNGHYLSTPAMDQLRVLAGMYVMNFTGNPVLHLNDSSLIWGGKFDVEGHWTSGDHAGHRRGAVIDIRANKAPGNIPESLFADFEDMAAKTIPAGSTTAAEAQLHCSAGFDPANNCVGDDNRHYHVLLLGVDQ
jgi:hypothetical protein